MDNYRLSYRKYFPFKQYIEIENVMQENDFGIVKWISSHCKGKKVFNFLQND